MGLKEKLTQYIGIGGLVLITTFFVCAQAPRAFAQEVLGGATAAATGIELLDNPRVVELLAKGAELYQMDARTYFLTYPSSGTGEFKFAGSLTRRKSASGLPVFVQTQMPNGLTFSYPEDPGAGCFISSLAAGAAYLQAKSNVEFRVLIDPYLYAELTPSFTTGVFERYYEMAYNHPTFQQIYGGSLAQNAAQAAFSYWVQMEGKQEFESLMREFGYELTAPSDFNAKAQSQKDVSAYLETLQSEAGENSSLLVGPASGAAISHALAVIGKTEGSEGKKMVMIEGLYNNISNPAAWDLLPDIKQQNGYYTTSPELLAQGIYQASPIYPRVRVLRKIF